MMVNRLNEPPFVLVITSAAGSGMSCGGRESGNDGKFELHVPLGEIGVFARKNESRYWPVIEDNPLHSKGIHKVKLTTEAPTATVTLKIGPKPGELKFDVRDKATGKPRRRLWRALDRDGQRADDVDRCTHIPDIHSSGY